MIKTHLVVLMVKNYFINPCNNLLLERVVVIQLVNKFPAFPGTWNIPYWIGKHYYITTLLYSSACLLCSLMLDIFEAAQMLFTFSDQNIECISHCRMYNTCSGHLVLPDQIILIVYKDKTIKNKFFLTANFLPSVTSSHLYSDILLIALLPDNSQFLFYSYSEQ